MRKTIISTIIIVIALVNFFAINHYQLIEALYRDGQPFDGVIAFAAIPFFTGIIGLFLLLADQKILKDD